MKLDALDVRFGYEPGRKVIDGASFSVEASETVSIVGPSGSGKSTLLRLLCGLLPSSRGQEFSGRVLINGKSILQETSYWSKVRSEGKIGFMFQDSGLLPDRNVEENILLPLRILRRHGDGQTIVSRYIARTGLEEAKHYLPRQLSGGMKTRAALARTLITGPELLLLDEPFSALDVLWKAKLYTDLLELKQTLRSTVVLVTHDIFEALFFSSRIMILRDDRSLHEFSVPQWTQPRSYDEVIARHSAAFIDVKELMAPPIGAGAE